MYCLPLLYVAVSYLFIFVQFQLQIANNWPFWPGCHYLLMWAGARIQVIVGWQKQKWIFASFFFCFIYIQDGDQCVTLQYVHYCIIANLNLVFIPYTPFHPSPPRPPTSTIETFAIKIIARQNYPHCSQIPEKWALHDKDIAPPTLSSTYFWHISSRVL